MHIRISLPQQTLELHDERGRLLRRYLAGRHPAEDLRGWFARHTNDELRAHLAGEALAPVERDLPAGRVPHGAAD